MSSVTGGAAPMARGGADPMSSFTGGAAPMASSGLGGLGGTARRVALGRPLGLATMARRGERDRVGMLAGSSRRTSASLSLKVFSLEGVTPHNNITMSRITRTCRQCHIVYSK